MSSRSLFASIVSDSGLAVGVVVCLTLLGCAPAADRLPITGTVTLDQEPLPIGVIRFVPREDPSRISEASIVEGKFEFTKENGPAAGDFDILVLSQPPEFEALEMARQKGQDREMFQTSIPQRYGVPGELSASLQAGQTEPLEFDLSSRHP